MMMIHIIQENGKKIQKKDMAVVYNFGKINQNIQDNGEMTNQMDMVNLNQPMGVTTQVNGWMEKRMEKVNL